MIEVAERYGVSRQTVHGWLGRYANGGLEVLADRSHRPRRCPHQMPAEVEAHLCELRATIPAGVSVASPTSLPGSVSTHRLG